VPWKRENRPLTVDMPQSALAWNSTLERIESIRQGVVVMSVVSTVSAARVLMTLISCVGRDGRLGGLTEQPAAL
jgi:hypothetical protein